MIKKKPMNRYIFFLGLLVLLISFLVPQDILNSFGPIRPVGLSTAFICPPLGILGLVLSISKKDWLFVLLNVLLVVSFPIVMAIGYALAS